MVASDAGRVLAAAQVYLSAVCVRGCVSVCVCVCVSVCVSGDVYTTSCDSATLLGLIKRQTVFTPVEHLKHRADFE